MKGLFLSLVLFSFNLSDGLIINCQFEMSFHMDKYACIVRQLRITDAYTEITNFCGKFDSNNTAKDVQVFEAHNQLVNYLPQSYKVFPNLNTILVVNCHQNYLLESDFSKVPNLTYIHLQKGEIKEIHLKTFEKNLLLGHISIDYHKIEELPKKLFCNLPNLQNVSFRGNKIEILDGSLFQFNTILRFVNFNDNKLKFIGLKMFDYFDCQLEIWFNRNECIDMGTQDTTIEYLREYVLKNCKELNVQDQRNVETSDQSPMTQQNNGESDRPDKVPTSGVDCDANNNFLKFIVILVLGILLLQSAGYVIWGMKYLNKV